MKRRDFLKTTSQAALVGAVGVGVVAASDKATPSVNESEFLVCGCPQLCGSSYCLDRMKMSMSVDRPWYTIDELNDWANRVNTKALARAMKNR